ncbi:MAG: NAD-dependent epimerase/dehydratase family protein, partial [Desulfobacula sp.]|nr:NAD-dependent epimerase/dehydratase family protein [Desulfobacula sp.]
MKILVTGAAGFIGFTLTDRLLKEGHNVCGIDNLNDYYDINLKKARLFIIEKDPKFEFQLVDLADRKKIKKLFKTHQFDYVVNLAAQAGVRHSIENPGSYIDSNLVGFGNILEGCRQSDVKHLVYASSSSVYGLNTHMPFSVRHNVDHPISL